MDLRASWQYVEAVAQERLKNNKTPRHVSIYGKDLELMGVAGELAARRSLGLDEDLHTHFDGGTDLIWRGRRVDVKTTKLTPRLEHRFLQWPQYKWVKADIVLMIAVDLETRQATVVGWVEKDELVTAEVNPERAIPCYEIPVPDLHPVWSLFTLGTSAPVPAGA